MRKIKITLGNKEYSSYVLILLLTLVLSSCEVQKYMSLTDGSKAEGTLTFSYDVGSFEKPVVHWDEAKAKANEKCKAWGYSGAEWLTDGEKQCIQYNEYGCVRWRYTYICQCTGGEEKETVIIKNKTELSQKDKAVKELKQAKELFEMGILTEEEYKEKVEELKPIIMAD